MALPDVTREELIGAMRRFDEERASDNWRNWEKDRNYDYAVVHNGRRYPPKRIISIATGAPENTFSGGVSGANRYLEKRDFVVEPLHPEPSDGTRFGYLLAILSHVAKTRPADSDAVRGHVTEAVKQLVMTRGNTVENYAESFNMRTLDVSRDQFYGLVLRALQGESGELGAQIRTAKTYASKLETDPTAEGRLQRVLDELSAVPTVTTQRSLAELISSFVVALDESGLRLPDGLPAAFLASVLAKPFVVLTGLSGSGKTQLAKKLGQWLGSARMRIVPVRPDWTGPEQLLGYEDALRSSPKDPRRPWFVPDVLAFLLEAAASFASEAPKPFVLILDEMNLAHVERYFADVLSGMESGNEILPDLERGSDNLWFERGTKKLAWPRNVIVLGTVNVDETTYSFSPKVLDRAFTIEFRVETSMLPSTFSTRVPAELVETDETFVRTFTDYLLGRTDVAAPHGADQIAAELKDLHARLTPHGAEFGFRTFAEASRFASIAYAGAGLQHDEILDLIVLEKILPKLHGARKRLEPLLLALGGFCARSGIESTDPTDSVTESRFPRSALKLARMLRSLRSNQFAGFAEG